MNVGGVKWILTNHAVGHLLQTKSAGTIAAGRYAGAGRYELGDTAVRATFTVCHLVFTPPGPAAQSNKVEQTGLH